MHKLVLLRHGLSEWNIQNRFTGRHDVDLAEVGMAKSQKAGQALLGAGFEWNIRKDETGYPSRHKEGPMNRLAFSYQNDKKGARFD